MEMCGACCRLVLRVLDVAKSVQTSYHHCFPVVKDVPLFFCWAPDRPSLLVREGLFHVGYDVGSSTSRLVAHSVCAESADGMALQWVGNPEVQPLAAPYI